MCIDTLRFACNTKICYIVIVALENFFSSELKKSGWEVKHTQDTKTSPVAYNLTFKSYDGLDDWGYIAEVVGSLQLVKC